MDGSSGPGHLNTSSWRFLFFPIRRASSLEDILQLTQLEVKIYEKSSLYINVGKVLAPTFSYLDCLNSITETALVHDLRSKFEFEII